MTDIITLITGTCALTATIIIIYFGYKTYKKQLGEK
jgi:hypothetical protein